MKTAMALAACAALLTAVPAAAQLRSEVVASGFVQPVAFVQDPSNPSVQYIVEQGGRIRVLLAGALQAADFLDLSTVVSTGGERGLLGLAFPPDYASSGRFYVNFTDTIGNTVVGRFKRSGRNALVADPGTRFDLQWPSGDRFIAQPFANHNGGNMAFGPDGYLYIGMGDGGSGNDPEHLAQDPATLLGKMLRIDVGVADADLRGYRVPPDNPFVDGQPVTALRETWAFGLRNPWRFSFDDPALGGTGAIVMGDVGQGAWEEINYEPAGKGGRNYGWRNREGAHDNVTTLHPAYGPLQDPIFEYNRLAGQAVTGGFVYRGTALGSRFFGRYFFADFVAARVWSLALAIDPSTGDATASDLVEHTAQLGGSGALGLISSFGVDAEGELYILNWRDGQVLRIAADSAAGAPAMAVDTPADGAMVTQPFRLSGWAIDPAANAGSGVDVVHVWAFPNPGSDQQPIFVGAATAREPRPDVGTAFGARFTNSGFSVSISGLEPGVYQLVAFARSTATGTFNNTKVVAVTVVPVVSMPRMAVDTPAQGSEVPLAFTVSGWALDLAASSGTGVDAIHVYAYPNPGSGAAPIFLGVAGYRLSRPDVGAAFDSRFTASGYGLRVTGLSPGVYQIVVFARSSVAGSFNNALAITVTVTAGSHPRMAVDGPLANSVAGQPFDVFGWALDLAAPGGTGVDAIHVYAYPNPGSGTPPIFLGVATYRLSRPDVGAVFGSGFTASGYRLRVAGLSPGVYQIVVFARSSVAGTFNNAQAVTVTILPAQ